MILHVRALAVAASVVILSEARFVILRSEAAKDLLLLGRRAAAEQQILRFAQDDRTRDEKALDKWLRHLADSAKFSGVVLVERGTKVLLNRAYLPAGGRRLTTESAFWLASTTKQFTAAAIMKLVDQGKLAVSDSLYHFFRRLPRDARAITVEQLLTHTSGVAPSGSAEGVTDREAAVRAILAEPLRGQPGETYHYEDEDYTLLGAVVETVAGVPFEAFVERTLLIPAGLTHTGFCGRLSARVTVAPPANAPAVPPPCSGGSTPVDWADRGATGLVGTAGDLLKWARALRAGKILSQRSAQELERGHVLVRREGGNDVYYSFGARIYMQGDRRREVWHSGYDVRVGQSSVVRLLENDLSIVVLSNSGLDASGQTWASAVARVVDSCLADSNGCERPNVTETTRR
jgi:CubicO group peptidase (beta-lactamase class C family)